MAGELWRGSFQVGLESTPNTTVPATRKMYFTPDSKLGRVRPPRPHKFATATRDNTRAMTLGPAEVGGTLKMPLSASEIIEFLLMGVKAGVAPAGAGAAKLWTFTPGTSLAPATIEWNDGAREWEAGGCYVNKLKFTGNVKGESMVEAEVFGMSLAAASLTGALTDRLPDFIEGWETKLYIDAFGGTAGSTAVSDLLINWEITLDNMLGRKKWANNTAYYDGITIGEIGISAKLMFEAAAAQALTEFNNWDAATERLVRVEFGNNENIAVNEIQTLTVTGTPTGGTFTITYAGQTTAGIAFDANAAAVDSALEALSNIGAGDVTCTGGPLPGTPVVITFTGALANTDVALMTTSDSFTGGTTPASAIVQTLAGGNQKKIVTVDLPGAWDALDLGGEDEGTRTYEMGLQYVYDTTNAYGLQIRARNERSAAW
jgi:hypothetical protein